MVGAPLNGGEEIIKKLRISGVFYYFLLILFSYLFRFRNGNCLGAAVFEFLNAAGGVNEFYFARVGGMTLGADFNSDLWLRRVHREGVSARADNLRVAEIGRMNVFFHDGIIICQFLSKVKDSAFVLYEARVPLRNSVLSFPRQRLFLLSRK